MYAACEGHNEIVELLLKAPGIDINAANNNGYVDVGRRGCRADMRTCGRTCMDRGHVRGSVRAVVWNMCVFLSRN